MLKAEPVIALHRESRTTYYDPVSRQRMFLPMTSGGSNSSDGLPHAVGAEREKPTNLLNREQVFLRRRRCADAYDRRP